MDVVSILTGCGAVTRDIYRKQQDDENATVKKHVIVSFLKRFNIRMRCRHRNRKQPKEFFS